MGRELLFSAGLGQPFISVNEAIQHYGDVIRRITRAENRLLLVSGPDWSPVQHRSVRSVRSESERRLSEFNARLAALCADLRVPHAELLPHFRGAGMRLRHTDGLHLSADGQRIEAELSLRRLTPLLSR
jgi:lysophospholipase L1-like esterase